MDEDRIMTGKHENPDFAKHLVNLASQRLGTMVLEVSDDFFAEAKRMLQDSEPVFLPDENDDHGKWMDGKVGEGVNLGMTLP